MSSVSHTSRRELDVEVDADLEPAVLDVDGFTLQVENDGGRLSYTYADVRAEEMPGMAKRTTILAHPRLDAFKVLTGTSIDDVTHDHIHVQSTEFARVPREHAAEVIPVILGEVARQLRYRVLKAQLTTNQGLPEGIGPITLQRVFDAYDGDLQVIESEICTGGVTDVDGISETMAERLHAALLHGGDA